MKQPHNVPIDGEPHGLKKYRAYELSHDYSYQWRDGSFHFRIFIPAGFKYDGASVPRIVWSLVGLRPDGLLRAAALVHDWIYEHKGVLPEGSYQIKSAGQWINLDTQFARKDADKMFKKIMREAGVKRVRRRLAYRAVRLGGWLPWNR